MNDPFCRVCGCTDRFGCSEGCHWVEPDLCSVCAGFPIDNHRGGITPMRRRSFTRTSIAACRADVPADMLAVYNPAGRLVGLAWHISEAQAMARGVDAYYQAMRGLPLGSQIAGSHKLIVAEMDAWRRHMKVTVTRPAVWMRGPIARRYHGHVVKIED